ncbi:uncharacterized protein [Antedon mediterranea]|uniref:uncharacterized protein isoform X2 n=1 Tax=Antedon mediterranea TaxID=105859 RepID=UPI003AF488B0
MSGRTKPKKKGFLSKFPSFRKKKSSSASSISPDKDANANPQPIQTQTFPPPPDFATDNNDTFTEPSQNLNIDETRVDNPNFKVAPVALTTSTTSQSAKRPNAMDEYEIGSSAKRMNSKSEDADCTIIVNTSVHSPSKPASTNQALKSAFFGVTPSNVETKPNGDVCSQSTNKIADLPIGSQMQTATTSVKKVDRSAKTDDNENPWQHKSDTGNDGKNKNDVWLSKGNNPWAKLPSPTGTQNSEKKESSEAPLQNDTFVLDKSVLNTTNKNATAFKKDLCNTNNIYLLDREKHDNRIRLTYTGNTTSSTFTGNADAGLPTTCEAMKNTDLNDEEIELEKASTGNSAQQQANDKPKADSHRLISTGSQDALVENSPRVSNIQGRHDSRSQSDSSPRNVSRLNGTTSQPIQSTPTKQMPLSTVRHPQLSAVKGRFYSNSVDSAELDSIASDDLMCDSRFIDDEVMGFDEESFLSDLADGPKNSILQTRLSRNGRIRSQSLEASSKHDEKVIDSRRLRSITMGASPPSKVYDSTPNGKILEEPQHMTNFNERSKENHVGFSRLNRSLHLNLTSQLSFTSDEEVTMDANTFRHLMQDMTNMKTMLFKLKRVIQDNNNAITGSLPTSPVTTVNPMLGQDNILVDLTQENVQLKTEITSMKRLIEETDKTVGRLHGELLEFQTAQTELSNRNQVPKRDVGVQADLPIISYKVYKPSYIPRPTTFRTRSEVSRIKAAFEEYMRINGRKIPESYPSAKPEQIIPLSPTKLESQQQQPKVESPKSPKKIKLPEQPLSPENKLPKPVKVSPTEDSPKPNLLQAPGGKSRQIQPPRQLHSTAKPTPEQVKEQQPRPSSTKSPSDSTNIQESPSSSGEAAKPKSKLPQSRLPKSNTLTKLGAHTVSYNGNQAKSDEDINTSSKSGSGNQSQSLTTSTSRSKLVPPSKVNVNKEENGNRAEKRYSDQTLEQQFGKGLESSKTDEPVMVKQKSKSKLMAPGFIKKTSKSLSNENVSSLNGNHDHLQNGLENNTQIKNGNKSEENLAETDTKKQAGKIKKPNSPKTERPLSGGMEGFSRIPAPKSRIARSTGIPSRKTNQP